MLIFQAKSAFLKLLALLVVLEHLESRKLVMIHQIFRHGARYPINPTPGDFSDYTTTENMRGELTPQGKHMHYILGKMIYANYWNLLFVGTQYAQKYHPSQILVRSTDYNRTLESAQAQLLGLLQSLPPQQLPVNQTSNSLPPNQNASAYMKLTVKKGVFSVYGDKNNGFHQAPIHEQAESLLTNYDPEICPNQNQWIIGNERAPEVLKIMNSKEVRALLSALQKATGLSIVYQQIQTFYDDYICAKYLSKKYLSLFDDPKNNKVAEFVSLANTIIKYFYTDVQRKAANTILLQTIVNNMKQAINNNGPRIVLYSAHDTTILSFGTALNFTNINCVMDHFYRGIDNGDTCISQYPIYATNYVIQLWQEDDLSHSVKILFNGVERKIPVCGYKVSCDFEDFENWATSFYVDVNATCGISQPSVIHTHAHTQRHHLLAE